jgi:hypothetical protein
MIDFLEHLVSIFMQLASLRACLIASHLFLGKSYLLYLDSLLTRGLLFSAVTQEAHRLCPWDANLERCIVESSQLMLVTEDEQPVFPVVSFLGTQWRMRSFHPKSNFILYNHDHGVTNGTLEARTFFGSYSMKISVVGRLTFYWQPSFSSIRTQS